MMTDNGRTHEHHADYHHVAVPWLSAGARGLAGAAAVVGLAGSVGFAGTGGAAGAQAARAIEQTTSKLSFWRHPKRVTGAQPPRISKAFLPPDRGPRGRARWLPGMSPSRASVLSGYSFSSESEPPSTAVAADG